VTCPTCEGSGIEPETAMDAHSNPCPDCKGTGSITEPGYLLIADDEGLREALSAWFLKEWYEGWDTPEADACADAILATLRSQAALLMERKA
jgi:hypothetical protein